MACDGNFMFCGFELFAAASAKVCSLVLHVAASSDSTGRTFVAGLLVVVVTVTVTVVE